MSETKKKKRSESIARTDMADLPVVGGWLGLWRDTVFANHAARREAKSAMFAELAVAAGHGIPIERALEMNAQTLGESRMRSNPAHPAGAQSRNRFWNLILSFLCLWGSTVMFLFYPLLAFRMVAVERIVRLLSLRLLRHVRGGASFSDAMRLCGHDYDEAEIRIAGAGEKWGSFPKALRALADFQGVESRLTIQGAVALYPFLVFWIAIGLLTFIGVKIMPKFAEIYSQLGAELPAFTVAIIDGGYYLIRVWPLAGAVFMAVVVFFVFRLMMNGHPASRWVALAPFILIGVALGGVASQALAQANMGFLVDPQSGALLLTLLAMFLTILVLPTVLVFIEATVLGVEAAAGPMVRCLPLLGASSRAVQEARWLGALALGLDAGAPGHEALRSAGQVCGGRLRQRTLAAAADVEKGTSIGEACVRRRVLRPAISGRLALLDRRTDCVPSLRAIAEDAAQDASETLNRSGRLTEAVSLLLMGAIVLCVLLACYTPLFMITMVVPVE